MSTARDEALGSAMAGGALDGVTILEAATLGAAPWVGAFLAEYGATVIKVEPPEVGDPVRTWGHMKNGVALGWKLFGRNKQAITLDLRHPRGQEIFRDLVATVDVVLVNFRPGRLERWGLSYEALSANNPGLIMVHVSAFGLTGPYASRPGFGTLVEAMSGFAHITGEADGPPSLPAFPLADGVAANAATIATLVALHHRNVNGGRGQLVDVSLLEPLSRLMEQAVTVYDQLGIVQTRTGNKWALTVPRNAYRTKDDHWIAMSGSAPSIAERAIRAIGKEAWLDDPVIATAQGRLTRVDEIDDAFADWIAERTLDEAMEVFERFEVAAAPVYSVDMLVEDPHVKERGIYFTVPDEDLGDVLIQGPTARLSETPGVVRHLGRALGADTDTVLAERLGLSPDELASLHETGVV